MGAYNIRLGSYLSFDEEKEQDLIKAMEQLNATHKMGQFMSDLVRIALENPEILNVKDGKYEKGAIIQTMDRLGMSYNRYEYINKVNKEVDELKNKVNKIYDMCQNMYILAQMGKHLGLEDKTNNSLMASFILERQIQDLQNTLGVGTLTPFSSNKLEDTQKRANEALQYIIETYTGIIEELKKITEPQVVVSQVTVPPVAETVSSVANNNTNSSATNINNTIVNKPDEKEEEEEYIDFGNADLGALSNFFGE